MTKPINVLLQTTIEHAVNDWHIDRFSMLRDYLASLSAPDGSQLFQVTARDRDPLGAPDSVLSSLDQSMCDELWLFAASNEFSAQCATHRMLTGKEAQHVAAPKATWQR